MAKLSAATEIARGSRITDREGIEGRQLARDYLVRELAGLGFEGHAARVWNWCERRRPPRCHTSTHAHRPTDTAESVNTGYQALAIRLVAHVVARELGAE